ncbi:putative hydrolase of the HAD superfamily [Actinoplanes lutulentus]|uniref:Putative hydrolase of the HAD superfamily n=1 Tax=Actinoplanes lutulentus TaxID=1287878 RepID=A0A327ZDL4_9ACTN|nr:HAD family hydrolase [Actinoplanes lutulentus]MBB2942651.1 putative hydrolase of the HAD superfamily [Actinoplanes lutulentus]RAK38232.1 putative hydrolase of the HAD superfamily [Actinoplanes lutulentus]
MILNGVLFDLDGTLGDHDGSVEAALGAWLPSIGVPASAENRALWEKITERHLAAWRRREIGYAEQRRRRLTEFLPLVGVSCEADELDTIFSGYLAHYDTGYRAYGDAVAAVAAAVEAGLAVAVLTNGSAAQQRGKLARIGLSSIASVFTPDDLGVAKPDPDAFRIACSRWGIAPGSVLSVGDNHAFDVLAARAAGLRAVHLDRTGAGPASEAHRISTLRELATYL